MERLTSVRPQSARVARTTVPQEAKTRVPQRPNIHVFERDGRRLARQHVPVAVRRGPDTGVWYYLVLSV